MLNIACQAVYAHKVINTIIFGRDWKKNKKSASFLYKLLKHIDCVVCVNFKKFNKRVINSWGCGL